MVVTLAALVAAPPSLASGPRQQTGGSVVPGTEPAPTGDHTGGAAAPRRKRRTQPRNQRGAKHRFPVDGTYDFGDAGMRFGARREGGRSHRGQDIAAAEGTPVLAVTAGTIAESGYDPAGAGYYLVLDARSEGFDYVYMHLKATPAVEKGQRVHTGDTIAEVGNTGHSFGAHLHFEIWRGAWFAGGSAIDPLPLLRSWRPAA